MPIQNDRMINGDNQAEKLFRHTGILLISSGATGLVGYKCKKDHLYPQDRRKPWNLLERGIRHRQQMYFWLECPVKQFHKQQVSAVHGKQFNKEE